MARRKQAWMGWGAPGMKKVAGWDFDHRLNGYITTAADRFSCDCGEEFPTPSGYRKCGSCGRAWNSYVIGSGGTGKEASLEKVIVREIPVRKNVIVANKRRVQGTRRRQAADYRGGPYGGYDSTGYYDSHGMHEESDGQHFLPGMGWKEMGPDRVFFDPNEPERPSPYSAYDEAETQMAFPPSHAGELHPMWKEYGYTPEMLDEWRTFAPHTQNATYNQMAEFSHSLNLGDGSGSFNDPKSWQKFMNQKGNRWYGPDENNRLAPQKSIYTAPRTQTKYPGYDDEGNPIKQARRRQAKGDCECWDGYERVPGTKPCAPGSCRKKAARRYVAWCRQVDRLPSSRGFRRFLTAEKMVRLAGPGGRVPPDGAKEYPEADPVFLEKLPWVEFEHGHYWKGDNVIPGPDFSDKYSPGWRDRPPQPPYEAEWDGYGRGAPGWVNKNRFQQWDEQSKKFVETRPKPNWKHIRSDDGQWGYTDVNAPVPYEGWRQTARRYAAWCREVGRVPSNSGFRRFLTAERMADRHDLRRKDLAELEAEQQDRDEVSIEHFSSRRQAELFDITDEGETRKGQGKKSDTPTMRKNPSRWTEHKQNGQYSKRWN